MKIGIPSAVAAAIAVVCVLVVTTTNPSPLSAAEQFKEVAKANGEYKGWVHVKSSSITVSKESLAQVTTQPGNLGEPKSVEMHINTEDKTTAVVQKGTKGTDIYLMSPATSSMWQYSSQTGSVTVSDVSDMQARAWVVPPVTVDQIVKSMSEEHGKYDVQRREDGDLVRYDLTPEKKDAAPTFVLWVAKDKLLRKVEYSGPSGDKLMMDVSYGAPEIKDIYGLGVPKDAKIVDHRSGKDTKAFLERLDQQAVAGLGDGLAMLTYYGLNEHGTTDKRYGIVHIFGRRGQDVFNYTYRVGKSRSGKVWEPMPANWPKLSTDDAARLLNDGKPIQGFIAAGDNLWPLWCSDSGYTTFSYSKAQVASSRWWAVAENSISGEIWGSPMRRMDSGRKVELVRDEKAHKGLLGVKSAGSEGYETTTWYDPARNDVPVEKVVRHAKAKQDTSDHTEYLKFSQLPDKRWYPTEWRRTRESDGKTDVDWYVLQVLPDAKLSDKWFENPGTRFGAQQEGAGSSSAPSTQPKQ